jgi:hypothetical protein
MQTTVTRAMSEPIRAVLVLFFVAFSNIELRGFGMPFWKTAAPAGLEAGAPIIELAIN